MWLILEVVGRYIVLIFLIIKNEKQQNFVIQQRNNKTEQMFAKTNVCSTLPILQKFCYNFVVLLYFYLQFLFLLLFCYNFVNYLLFCYIVITPPFKISITKFHLFLIKFSQNSNHFWSKNHKILKAKW